jgi:predicted RecB family nuclease
MMQAKGSGVVGEAAITASMLYNLVTCPKRVALDLFGDQERRDPISPFVQLLWERGNLFEKQTISDLDIPFLDLSEIHDDEKERLTRAAMVRGEALIYGGQISADGLLGVPDLLRKTDGGYVPGDIKAGAGEEGGGDDDEDDGKPKIKYAVQLGLYVDILERLRHSAGRNGFIWDVHGREVSYDFMAPRGSRSPETLWDHYRGALADAQAIVVQSISPKGAYAGVCKLCQWRSACHEELKAADDLTLIPQLGRTKRDSMEVQIPTVMALADCNPDGFISKNKTPFKGVGPGSLKQFHDRAKLLKSPDPKPYLKAPVTFPVRSRELFFDIETDSMRDFCYLHGIVVRENGDNTNERFVYFFSDDVSAEGEKKAFADAISFFRAAQPATIFYYSKYERTVYRNLQERHPEVCSSDDVEQLFDPASAIDLYYDVVLPDTEWPTNDFSIKTLARFLGFTWRDTDPSGAASIEWFNRWVETGDGAIKQRILDYNEDDCRATRVLLDGIRGLS